MRKQVGLAIVSMLAMICMPRFAPAGCPAWDIITLACSADASSIESCVNQLWFDVSDASALTESLARAPSYPAARMARIRTLTADIPVSIRVFGEARDYSYQNGEPKCDGSWIGIQRCKLAIVAARRGLDLLTRPELVARLSAATRERLKRTLREHEAKYVAQLDLVAASFQGDPAQLCTNTYAAIATCERAIAADSAAIRDQVFPVYDCDQLIPGKFLTAKDAAADARRAAEPPAPVPIPSADFNFNGAIAFYRRRLNQETELLEQARQAR
jgi:hypothetical protein